MNRLSRFSGTGNIDATDSAEIVDALEADLKEQRELLARLPKFEFSTEQIERLESARASLSVMMKDYLRRCGASLLPQPSIVSGDGTPLGIHVMEASPPWIGVETEPRTVPGMITAEEAKYYKWLARFYAGAGRVVELGPWLGSSTLSIVEGLRDNPAFEGETLLVFDDFVWRSSWMDPYVAPKDRVANHGDFRHLFDRHTAPIASSLSVEQSRFAIYDGNERVAPLVWHRGAIEMLFVDCGRTIEANEGWYSALSPHFIPDKTIIVMQDWRLHREVPVRWYNQTDLFTGSKEQQLQMVHELCDGGVATFIFRGKTT